MTSAVDVLRAEYGELVIAFRPNMARSVGGIYAAIFLQQLMFHCKDDPDAWYWHTQKQIESETSLTRSQQDTARRELTERDLIEEDLKGVPAKLHFRVKWENVATQLACKQGCEKLQTQMPEIANSPAKSRKHIRVNNQSKEENSDPTDQAASPLPAQDISEKDDTSSVEITQAAPIPLRDRLVHLFMTESHPGRGMIKVYDDLFGSGGKDVVSSLAKAKKDHGLEATIDALIKASAKTGATNPARYALAILTKQDTTKKLAFDWNWKGYRNGVEDDQLLFLELFYKYETDVGTPVQIDRRKRASLKDLGTGWRDMDRLAFVQMVGLIKPDWLQNTEKGRRIARKNQEVQAAGISAEVKLTYYKIVNTYLTPVFGDEESFTLVVQK